MKSFRSCFRLRTRARGSLETNHLSNRPHAATAACKARISSLPLVQSVLTAVRCRALTTPKWMRPFLKGQPGNQISSAISIMEIRANFAPEHRALNLMRHAKSSNLRNHGREVTQMWWVHNVSEERRIQAAAERDAAALQGLLDYSRSAPP